MKVISPVYSKEMVELAIKKGPFWLRTVYLCVLLFLTTLFLWQLPEHHDPNKYAEVGKYLFIGLAIAEGIAAMLLTPIITAGCIAGEREANTLELLFLTRLKPWNIVVDKALSRVSFMVFLFVVTLPFMFIALFLGGVELRMLLIANGYLLCILLFAGGLSVLLSAMRRNYVSALVSVYAYQVLIFIITSIASSYLLWSKNTFFLIINPLFAIGSLGANTAAVSSTYPTVITALAFYMGISFLFAYWASKKVAASVADPEVCSARVKPRKKGGLSLGVSGKDLVGRQLRLRPTRLHLPDGVHWVSRESFKEFIQIYRPVLIVIGVGLIFILCMAKSSAFTTGIIYLFSYWMIFPLAFLVTLVKASSSFSQEKMKGTLPIVLTTQLKGPEIVKHTILSVASSVYVLCLIPLVALVIGNSVVGLFDAGYRWDDMRPSFGYILPLYILMFAFYMLLGILFSLKSKTSGRAIMLSMATVLILQLVIPVAGAALTELFRLRWLFGDGDVWAMLSTAVWLFGCSTHEGVKGITEDWLWMYVFQLAFHGVGAFIIWFYLRNWFNHIVKRQPDY